MKAFILSLSFLTTLAFDGVFAFNDAFETKGNIRMKNTFEIQSWDESPYLEFDSGAKYSRAKLKKKYTGLLTGDGTLEYLMAYNQTGAAHFTGIEHFEGEVDGNEGTISIVHEGVFEAGVVNSTFRVIEGSQTAGLINLKGEGSFKTGHSMSVEFDFNHSF